VPYTEGRLKKIVIGNGAPVLFACRINLGGFEPIITVELVMDNLLNMALNIFIWFLELFAYKPRIIS
jgi:hypothetical protein